MRFIFLLMLLLTGSLFAQETKFLVNENGQVKEISVAEARTLIGVVMDTTGSEVQPVAEFRAFPLFGTAPLSVTFDNQSVFPDGSTSLWDFGNGITSNIESPVYVYQNPGTFNIRLVVTAPSGKQSVLTRNNYVTVSERGPPPSGDHAHFDRAAAAAGVVQAVSYRTPNWVEDQSEADGWDEVRGPDIGDSHYPSYDTVIDGLKIFVRDGQGPAQTQIRRRFPHDRVTGDLWTQWEMRPSNDFVNVANGGYKLFRWEDDDPPSGGDKRVLTLNSSAGKGADAYPSFRDGHKVWQLKVDSNGNWVPRDDEREVRVWYADSPPTIDYQPGGETRIWRNDRDPIGDGKPGFYWKADTWTRLTVWFDRGDGNLHVWAQHLEGSDTRVYKIIEFPVEYWDGGNWGVTRLGPWGHSTSGVSGTTPNTYWGYRNLIISRNPIALN